MSPAQLRILVPLENPHQDHNLVDLAATLAPSPWGELHLTHILTPDAEPLPDIEQALQVSADRAMAHDIGAIAHLEEDEDVTSGIQRAVRRWSCNMMLMAWKANVERDAILSAPNRALTKAIDVDTLIFKEKKRGAGAPDSRALRRRQSRDGGGVQIAYDLAQTWGAELEILRIVRDTRDPSDPILQRYCSQLAADTRLQLELLKINVPLTVVPAVDVVPAIVEKAQDHDLIVLGAQTTGAKRNIWPAPSRTRSPIRCPVGANGPLGPRPTTCS